MVDFLRGLRARRKLNILISGGTGSGKTTLLNVLSGFIPDDERIVTIEDAAELQLQQPHVVRLETRPRQHRGQGRGHAARPGQATPCACGPTASSSARCRGGEALDMLQAMNTGHDGSLTTVHANTPRDALARLETMVLMAGIDLPVRAIREQIASALDLIVQVRALHRRHAPHHAHHRGHGHGRRHHHSCRTSSCSSSQGVDEDGKVLRHARATGIRPACYERLALSGHPIDLDVFFAR